jgi:hypothetical protein
MADYRATSTEFTAVADAIRTKGGTSAQLTWPNGFVSAVQAIPTGGSNLQEKTVTQNGVVLPDAGYDGLSRVIVNVPTGGQEPAVLYEDGEEFVDFYTWIQSNTNTHITFDSDSILWSCQSGSYSASILGVDQAFIKIGNSVSYFCVKGIFTTVSTGNYKTYLCVDSSKRTTEGTSATYKTLIEASNSEQTIKVPIYPDTSSTVFWAYISGYYINAEITKIWLE